jgi:4-aminobutyrate aminotransferase
MGHGETVVAYIEEEIIGRLIPPDDFAGILIEPIQGEGGYVVPPDDFFPALKALCDKYGIVLIADEVQSGMGRTGKWWAIENFGIEPDMITSAKGLASGMPLGALISKADMMSWPRGSHGNTYGGNPIACAASLATIDQIEKGYLENTRVTGAYAKEGLLNLQKKHKSIGDVRGFGFMLGIEFVKDRKSKIPAIELRDDVVHFGFERGLLLLGCGKSVIRITPPLSTSKQEVDEALAILDESIRLAEEKHDIS